MPMHWMFMPLRRYAEFSGRSRRLEYWMFTLGVWVLSTILNSVFFAFGMSFIAPVDAAAMNPEELVSTMMTTMEPYFIVMGLISLALFIPTIAVTVRRLHDTNRSGWWILMPWGALLLSFMSVILGGMLAAITPALVIVGIILAIVMELAALAGFIVLLVFMFLEGTRGPNRFGEDPKGATTAEVFG